MTPARDPKQKIMEKSWEIMANHAIWTHLGPSGPKWARLGPSGPVWARSARSGPVWARLGPNLKTALFSYIRIDFQSDSISPKTHPEPPGTHPIRRVSTS